MWIIGPSGFISIVQHNTDPDLMRVRARRREHLINTFDMLRDGDIIDLGANAPDYRWHCELPRTLVAQAVAESIMNEVTYVSHAKEAIAKDDRVFYSALLGTWRELHRLQEAPPAPPEYLAGHRVPSQVWVGAQWAEAGPPSLDDLGEIVDQVGELADKMLAAKDGPAPAQTPLTVETWGDYEEQCAICGNDFATGDDFVTLPEDDEYNEPEAPAHVLCAEEEGWTVEQ